MAIVQGGTRPFWLGHCNNRQKKKWSFPVRTTCLNTFQIFVWRKYWRASDGCRFLYVIMLSMFHDRRKKSFFASGISIAWINQCSNRLVCSIGTSIFFILPRILFSFIFLNFRFTAIMPVTIWWRWCRLFAGDFNGRQNTAMGACQSWTHWGALIRNRAKYMCNLVTVSIRRLHPALSS